MATIFVLTGGVLGFAAGIVALAMGQGVLTALALWSGAGIAFTLIALTLALLPRQEPARAAQRA